MSELAVHGGAAAVTLPLPVWPPYREEVAEAVAEVARSDTWASAEGPYTQAFAERFATLHGARFAVPVVNGSISLEIALRALGIGRGDEVIVPAYTFITSATSVLMVNALPVFVDVTENGNLDPAAVEAAITPRTRAIMPVHFAGHSADMAAISQLAARHGVAVIEDAAQAHGATWEGRPVGAIGEFGSFSFQSSKNVTGGEGGILLTDDERLFELAWGVHTCGRMLDGEWYQHVMLGSNYRMTEFQCAAIGVQLNHLDDDVARRERGAARLTEGLNAVGGLIPVPRDERATAHAWHLYQTGFDADAFSGLTRQQVLEALWAENAPAGAGYGRPVNRQPVFSDALFDHAATGYDPERPGLRYGELSLPVSERLCAEAVWFPQNLLLAGDELIDQVVEAVAKVRAGAAGLSR